MSEKDWRADAADLPMVAARRFRITGGPSPADVRVVDLSTGADITASVRALTIRGTTEKLVEVDLTGFAEFDLEAELTPALYVPPFRPSGARRLWDRLLRFVSILNR
jgi:hypothetical protein